MNHTGSVSGRSPRSARTSGEPDVRPETSGCEAGRELVGASVTA
jgi:hypothetical protein